jgi:hypothetical protein
VIFFLISKLLRKPNVVSANLLSQIFGTLVWDKT